MTNPIDCIADVRESAATVMESPGKISLIRSRIEREARYCPWEVIEPGKRFRALAVVQKDEEGSYYSFSPSLPGAGSQGETPEKALASLEEAIAGCIEAYLSANERIPWVTDPVFEGPGIIKRWIDINV